MNRQRLPDPRRTAWGRDGISRRQFIGGAATLVAAGGGTAFALTHLHTARGTKRTPICMALHVHASGSEGVASMESQLAQAADTGVEVLWWTEHDQRLIAHDAPEHVAFTGAHESSTGGAGWSWVASTEGDVDEAAHTFETSDSNGEVSPHRHALNLRLRTKPQRVGAHSLSGQAQAWLNRTSLAGLTISLALRPKKVSATSFVAVDIVTSYRPARGARRAGIYVLSYRVGGAGVPGASKVVDQTTGIVYLSAPPGRWTSVVLKPELDLASLWPGTDGRDASLHEFVLKVSANDGGDAQAYVADLRFLRHDPAPLRLQSDLMRHYAAQFPTVRQMQALEVSLTTPHLGWYGGRPLLADYRNVGPLPELSQEFARDAVKRIHAHGGLASYCHPFGVSHVLVSADRQRLARAAKSAELVANRALGCDLIEVGYRIRGGCSLQEHEALWDNCSRNGIFLTGVGVSDDHSGLDWRHSDLNFVTWAWADGSAEEELLRALRGGQVFFGDLARFGGALDLELGGRSAMGGVAISDDPERSITVLATGLPDGASVELLAGTVDFAGPKDTEPQISRTSLAKSDFDSEGRASTTVDTSESRFVRLVVKDRAGLTIALGNPLWLLRASVRPAPPAWRML